MSDKVTLSDIARESGVSNATVSLVINNRPGISDETRQRVLQVAERLGYPLKHSQGSEQSLRLNTIGLFVKADINLPPLANPFYSNVIIGIENACRRSGVNLLLSTLPVDQDNHPISLPPLLYSSEPDGFLLVGTFVDQTILSALGDRKAPIVLVDGYSDTDSYDAVVSDNFQAAYDAVRYLIERGHRYIGLVGGEPQAYPSLEQRRNGYRRALKDIGIDSTYVANFNINQGDGSAEVTALLQANPHITALFCVNDQTAVNAMRAAQELGRRVPSDLSVVGYDDTYLAASANPPLTTMHVDTVAMGIAATYLLQLRIENPDDARMTLTVHSTLVERDSTAPPRGR